MKPAANSINILWTSALAMSIGLYLIWQSGFEHQFEFWFGLILGGLGLLAATIHIFVSR